MRITIATWTTGGSRLAYTASVPRMGGIFKILIAIIVAPSGRGRGRDGCSISALIGARVRNTKVFAHGLTIKVLGFTTVLNTECINTTFSVNVLAL
jgi:hypothetical protein